MGSFGRSDRSVVIRFSLLIVLGLFLVMVTSAHAATGVDQLGPCSSADKVVSQPDGSTVALGVTGSCSSNYMVMVKLTPNGYLDSSFGKGGIAMLPGATGVVSPYGDPRSDLVRQPDGRLLVVADSTITRFLPDGSLDTAYGTKGTLDFGLGEDPGELRIKAETVDPSNRLLLTTYDGHASPDGPGTIGPGLRRYLPDGALDPSFGSGGQIKSEQLAGTSGNIPGIDRISLGTDGSVFLSGVTNSGATTSWGAPIRGVGIGHYSSSGAIDTGYGDGGVMVETAAYDPSGWLPISLGSKVDSDGSSRVVLLTPGEIIGLTCPHVTEFHFNPDGSFTGSQFFSTCVDQGLAVTGTGLVATGTTFESYDDVYIPNSFDIKGLFGAGGDVETEIGNGDSYGRGIVEDSSGRYLAVGQTATSTGTSMTFARYTKSGTGLDPSFGYDDGITTIPRISCPDLYLSDGPLRSGMRGRCSDDKPVIKASASIRYVRRKPVVNVLLSLPQRFEGQIPIQVRLSLPAGLKLSLQKRSRLVARQPGLGDSRVQWKRLTAGSRNVTFKAPANPAVAEPRLSIDLGQGTMRRIPKDRKGHKVVLSLAMTYDSPNPDGSRIKGRVKVRIPKK